MPVKLILNLVNIKYYINICKINRTFLQKCEYLCNGDADNHDQGGYNFHGELVKYLSTKEDKLLM